jgi:rhamnogalacturonyl hydrolase YesR
MQSIDPPAMRFVFHLAPQISRLWLPGLIYVCGFLRPAVVSGQSGDGNLARRRAIESSVRLANAYYQETFSLGSAVWNRGVYHGGNMALYRTLRIVADRDYSLSWAAANQWLPGPEAGGGADADSQACGQAYLDLYELDPQPVRKAAIKAAMDALVASYASADDWWWVDAFYMAGPTLARLARIENDPAYLVQLEKMYGWMKTNRGLFDPARGLWYRDQTAKARTGANTPQFWGRGNGWAIAACARILEQLPAGDPRRAEFASMLQTMASALLPLQGADGFWRSNLFFPAQYPTPETSCTAFFTYAIAYGINEGLLDDATYRPVVDRAWDGMTALALNSAGRLGYVQAIGAAPAASTPDGQQDYGYGAFALAACEMLRLLGGPAPVSAVAGQDWCTTDSAQVYETQVRLDASGSVLRDVTSPIYSWWLGDILLGQGRVLDVPLPLGRHQMRLVIQRLGETDIYAELLDVQVAP